MPPKSDKRTRVDKIRKTPLEPTRSSGVFRTVFIFRRIYSAVSTEHAKAPPLRRCGGGLRDITARAHSGAYIPSVVHPRTPD